MIDAVLVEETIGTTVRGAAAALAGCWRGAGGALAETPVAASCSHLGGGECAS